MLCKGSGLTTSQLPPIPLHTSRPRRSITTNKIQPIRHEIPVSRKTGFGRVISTSNIEEIQAENRGEAKPKRGRPKGK